MRVVKIGATDWSGRTGVILSDGSYDRIEQPMVGHIVRMGRVRPLIEYREDRDVWSITHWATTQPGGVRFEVSTQELIGFGSSSHDICAFLLEAASRAVWEEEERRKAAVEKAEAKAAADWDALQEKHPERFLYNGMVYYSVCDAKAAELAREAMSCESSEEFDEITQKLEGEQNGKS